MTDYRKELMEQDGDYIDLLAKLRRIVNPADIDPECVSDYIGLAIVKLKASGWQGSRRRRWMAHALRTIVQERQDG